MLALHGATGSGDSMLRGTRAAADAHGVVVLSPSSRAGTWDAIRATFGDDLARIDQLLGDAFDRCAIDPSRVAVGGFSDGASYALSIGLINGDLFTHVIGHSPGFLIPGRPHGKPKIFISHGRQDPILPIDQCGRRIVSMLKATGYTPRFDEFDGGHMASPEMRDTALAWFTAVPESK
jgi:phospholipase/carboxylesterase